MENCISASDMPFKNSYKLKVVSYKIRKIFLMFLLVTCHLSLVTAVNAEVVERIVAIVDDEIITLSEFKDALRDAINSGAKKTDMEVLGGMINRILLLREGKKFRLEESAAESRTLEDNAIINDYMERRLKTLIHIPPEEIEQFYEKNRESFKGKDFYDVRNDIETYLVEKQLNRKLLEHINELREKSYIRIQLEN
ncbi:MAG: hypothetical protein HY759_05510 [Nitrospirae bacterium]|nr:hypothetical protein [Nitrospirota bacterium]